MAPNITLYRKNGSCAFIPHALLRYVALPCTHIELKAGPDRKYMAADNSFSNVEYLAINPNGYVPALRVDEEIITELPAVLTTIVHLSSNPELLGRTALERGKVTEWMIWLSGTLHSLGFAAIWRPYRFVEDHKEAYDAVKEKGRKVIDTCFKRINERLEGRQFAVGQSLTTVDFQLYLFARWAGNIGIKLDEEYPNYAAVAREVEKLKAVKETISIESLKFAFGPDGAHLSTGS
jgi:glutathione S-transferase